jgi:ribose transport system ATP-binding protein
MSEASPVTDHAAPLVAVRDLWKHFGGVQALKGVELQIFPGEVHGLVGANGAGKSTLIKILAGLEQPDHGAIIVEGTPVQLRGAQPAAELGFSFIHQELNLVPHLNVLENIVLGAPKSTRCGLIDWRSVRAQVSPIANKVGITFSLDAPLARLSTAERWLVTICRALVRRTRLMVLDEATASLSIHEAENLFRIVRSLASEGVAILYVSHRLDEILDLCARVTAFRDGRRVLDAVRERFTRQQLVEAIVGGAAPAATPTLDRVVDTRDVLLEIEQLARMIFGADRPDCGRMRLAGAAFAPNSPSDAMKAGIGLVPEERRSEGLILKKSVGFNLGLTVLSSLQAASWLPLIRLQRRGRVAQELSSRLRIKTPSVDTAVDRLSAATNKRW